MAKRKTEQERRAELAAKIARIDERDAARKARESSEDVRRFERDIATLDRIAREMGVSPNEQYHSVRAEVFCRLEEARAAALAAPGKGQS